MDSKKWNMYLDILQGHPSIAYTNGVGSGVKEVLDKYIPSSEYHNLLDIGAADGRESVDLLGFGYNVKGLTLGLNNVTYAKKKYNIDMIEADVHDLPFSCDTFDVVYMNQVLEHFLSPFVGMLEINSVLKEGGRLFTNMPAFVVEGGRGELSYHHPSALTPEMYRALFKATGFKMIYDDVRGHNCTMIVEKDSTLCHSSITTVLGARRSIFK